MIKMEAKNLRLIHARFFIGFGLKDFKDRASELEKIVKSYYGDTKSELFIFEDYNNLWSLFNENPEFSGWIGEGDGWEENLELVENLEDKKIYDINQLNRGIWENSYFLYFLIKDKKIEPPFRVCLLHDKSRKNILYFYGKYLDYKLYEDIKTRFGKSGFLYMVTGGYMTGIPPDIQGPLGIGD